MRLFIAGHNGMVGRALVRRFGDSCDMILAHHDELDLTDQRSVAAFYRHTRPDAVIVAAAKVGGIHANATYPANFMRDNLAIALNCIHEAFTHGVRRLLFLGSSCIYPRDAAQPMPESCLLTGSLEATNEAYAVAKIAGLKMCEHYRTQYGVAYHAAMPTNLYGPHDNYHPENSHVIPAMIRRFHEAMVCGAASVTLWGTGSQRREFLHVDDVSDACAFLLAMRDPPQLVNVGCGVDLSIRELAALIAEVVGYAGAILWDTSRPDGTPRKLLDVSLMRSLGWTAKIGLRDGLTRTYAAFCEELKTGTIRR